jgi:hypothetical protein
MFSFTKKKTHEEIKKERIEKEQLREKREEQLREKYHKLVHNTLVNADYYIPENFTIDREIFLKVEKSNYEKMIPLFNITEITVNSFQNNYSFEDYLFDVEEVEWWDRQSDDYFFTDLSISAPLLPSIKIRERMVHNSLQISFSTDGQTFIMEKAEDVRRVQDMLLDAIASLDIIYKEHTTCDQD